MSRLNAQQAQSFPENTGRGSFLSLSNDGDSAVVRVAYNNVDDIPIYLVHDVPVDGRNRQVGCLRTDNSQPDSVCPLCANGSYPRKVYYFNVRNEETDEMQIWSRSEAFFKKNMETLLREYNNSGTPLTDIPIKIIRKGAREGIAEGICRIASGRGGRRGRRKRMCICERCRMNDRNTQVGVIPICLY